MGANDLTTSGQNTFGTNLNPFPMLLLWRKPQQQHQQSFPQSQFIPNYSLYPRIAGYNQFAPPVQGFNPTNFTFNLNNLNVNQFTGYQPAQMLGQPTSFYPSVPGQTPGAIQTHQSLEVSQDMSWQC